MPLASASSPSSSLSATLEQYESSSSLSRSTKGYESEQNADEEELEADKVLGRGGGAGTSMSWMTWMPGDAGLRMGEV